MSRSRCKNAYFRNKTAENWEKYRKLRNECVKLTKKVKREYFANLNMNCIKDNRTFWKTIKVNFTNKNDNNTKKIILVENDDIISDNSKVAEIMNNYFVNITEDLNIPAIKKNIDNDSNAGTICMNPMEKIILNYSEHPSILTIKKIVLSAYYLLFLKYLKGLCHTKSFLMLTTLFLLICVVFEKAIIHNMHSYVY